MIRMIEGWFFALAMVLLRATCRVAIHGADPRVALNAASAPYVYSILHAQQVAAAINREKGTAAMVSQSADGQLLMAGFWALGIRPVRGSSRGKSRDKGGLLAIDTMIRHVRGGRPALIAVDGPRGPRNRVRKGIAVLSRQSGGAVLNVVLVPTRRWVLGGAWDRMQIPKPFCRIDAYFAKPLTPEQDESVEAYRGRIEASLNDLEREHDPSQAPPAAVRTSSGTRPGRP
ncbi:MAG: DUF374 domain-containing protein [Planctomycetota bacterium]